MSEYQGDIATSAASEHVTNVLKDVVNAGGGYAQNATKDIGAKIGKLERQKAKREIQKSPAYAKTAHIVMRVNC